MDQQHQRLYQLHADYCRSLANPTRLRVLDCLREGELSVGVIAEQVNAPLSTVSKHLGSLRNRNILESRKDRQTVYYRLADARVIQACEIIRAVLIDAMRARGEFARELEVDDSPSSQDMSAAANTERSTPAKTLDEPRS